METEFYRVRDVVKVLGLGKTKVYELIAQGVLPSVKVAGRSRRVTREGLEAFIKDMKGEVKQVR